MPRRARCSSRTARSSTSSGHRPSRASERGSCAPTSGRRTCSARRGTAMPGASRSSWKRRATVPQTGPTTTRRPSPMPCSWLTTPRRSTAPRRLSSIAGRATPTSATFPPRGIRSCPRSWSSSSTAARRKPRWSRFAGGTTQTGWSTTGKRPAGGRQLRPRRPQHRPRPQAPFVRHRGGIAS